MVLAVLRGENWGRELGRLPFVAVAAGGGCLVGRATILFVSSVGAVALTVTRPSLHSKTVSQDCFLAIIPATRGYEMPNS